MNVSLNFLTLLLIIIFTMYVLNNVIELSKVFFKNSNLLWQERVNILGFLVPHYFFIPLLLISLIRFRKQLKIEEYDEITKEDKIVRKPLKSNFIDYLIKLFVLLSLVVNIGYAAIIYTEKSKNIELIASISFFIFTYFILLFVPYFPYYLIALLNYYCVYGYNTTSKTNYIIAIIICLLNILGFWQKPFRGRKIYSTVLFLVTILLGLTIFQLSKLYQKTK